VKAREDATMSRGDKAKNFLDKLQRVSTMLLYPFRVIKDSAIDRCSHLIMKWMDEHPDGSKPRRRRIAYDLMLNVCQSSGELPSSMEILEVTFTSDEPIGFGSFNDLFVGTHNGNKVMIKRHRKFQKVNSTTWKVSSTTLLERATRRELVLTAQT
jgi:hypothetical protein